jgi:tRNAThr (cytosine32-N3)-methyltransferase
MTADVPEVVAAAGQPDAQEKLAADMSSLEIAQSKQQPDLAPHRSHDPDYNQKRSDPFQFGSRYLGQEDNVFEFNAWDHVETDDTYKEYAEQQYAMQREAPVSDFDKSKWTCS